MRGKTKKVEQWQPVTARRPLTVLSEKTAAIFGGRETTAVDTDQVLSAPRCFERIWRGGGFAVSQRVCCSAVQSEGGLVCMH